MKKLQSKFASFSLDSSTRNSDYYELNDDVQVPKSNTSKSKSSSRVQSPSKSMDSTGYMNYDNNDLLNDAKSSLRVDTPHMFHDSDSSITIVMIIADASVEMVYKTICQPESYVNLSPQILFVSFGDSCLVSSYGQEHDKEAKRNQVKVDMTVSKKRLIFWDKMETLSGYFLLPLPSLSDASPNKHTTSLRATPFSLPKLMELHTQDPINGDEIRYQYIISDHAEGTKVACKITEDKRMVKNCDRKRSSSSATSTGLVQKTRLRIFELMNKSKINRIAREQKVFLNNFKDHLKEIAHAPTQLVV